MPALGNIPKGSSYKYELNGRRAYDLKTNRERDDYIGLVQFIQTLNTSDDDELVCRLEKVFNIDEYLKILAFDVLIGNWDGYAYNKNNYYLYENPYTRRVEYIPYDLDNTWGVDWFGEDWAQQSIYWWNDESRPLYDRLMDDPVYREQFSFYINQWIEEYFNVEYVTERAEYWQELIRKPYYILYEQSSP